MDAQVVVHTRHVSDDPAHDAILDDSELARALRRSDPASYRTAHALLRTVAAERTGQEPRAIRWERVCATCGSTSHGKPVVAGHPEVHLSLSYAGSFAVVASADFDTGVDVEEVGKSDFEGFDVVTLAAEEVPAMKAVAPQDRAAAQARVWARKEAVLKATGHGLVVDPKQVVVTGPAEPAALVAWHGQHPMDAPIRITDIELGTPGYAAALAVLTDLPLAVTVDQR